jgi:quercetin dioxygenase-like cupin family protein
MMESLGEGEKWPIRLEREAIMTFWNLTSLELSEFRPGIHSAARLGENLIMAFMEIGPSKEDPGHAHPFDQCGIVIQGEVEMFVGDESRRLGANQTYFIPAGIRHGWKTFEAPVRILDVSGRATG